ncbi:3-phenylpropionate/cinnamic acid dioxygenase subunit beta [Aromatoleum toluvorans]|uniref:3-phenylpropionate/cinnamic acid dioxygenase subunit beta n=1 Tax=Aromatoleum toluvorans TaxID=92002 RepID=A0ABX1PVD2_9RHOO|nr:3-phenylpropionate/cinnamic acid dioxygenase subunit beta [Aromatoleum toluvorans]NMG42174.1 3-phenylpropionate/cinnamic acid dioxygenase subunit beta [Aromatoleum toluvorans]
MSAAQQVAENAPVIGNPIPVGAEVYNRIVGFLYQEATLLDTIRLKEWGATLAPDLVYTVPLRQTRPMSQQAQSVIRTVQHYHDNYRSIMGRIMRLTETRSAWAEDPPSRTRRMVSNVQVFATDRPDEFAVVSYLLLTRSRFDFPDMDLISGERNDLLRVDGEGFKLVRREVILDQAVLGTPNLAIFL